MLFSAVLVFMLIPAAAMAAEESTESDYTYEIYYLDDFGDTWYSGCERAVYLKTDNPKAVYLSLRPVDEDVSITLYNISSYADVEYLDTVPRSGFYQVEGGYILTFSVDTEDESLYGTELEIEIRETNTSTWTSESTGYSFTIQLVDYDEALNEWIDTYIDAYTAEDMDSFEKMSAVCDVMAEDFKYLLNDGNNLIYLASAPSSPCFLSYCIDSYISPALLVRVAERIGGFDDIHNCYYDYDYGTSQWSATHFYCECTIGDETRSYSICPVSSTNRISSEDIEMIDFTDTDSLTLAQMLYSSSAEEEEGGSGCSHEYELSWSWDTDSYAWAKATLTCSLCGETATLDAEISQEASLDPTCTEEGEITWTAAAEYEGETYTDTVVETVSATGHSYDGGTVTTEATCMEDGVITYTCTSCGHTYAEAIEATGHTYGEPEWEWDDYSSATAVFTCETCGVSTTMAASITSEAGEDTSIIYTATVTLDGVEYTSEKTKEYSSDYEECLQDEACPISAFTDADPTAWYHDGVHFCIENGLMNGTSSITFEPSSATTRSMIVTMLYRLAGSPEVSGSSKFTDVEPGSWYEDAVIWAEQNDIANGYDNGEFGVSDNVTREQLAAFFYRYADEVLKCDMTVDADLSDDAYDFVDVDEVSSWAYTELCWAVAEGLISGQSIGGRTYLAPGSDAMRSETATILMRFIQYFNIELEE